MGIGLRPQQSQYVCRKFAVRALLSITMQPGVASNFYHSRYTKYRMPIDMHGYRSRLRRFAVGHMTLACSVGNFDTTALNFPAVVRGMDSTVSTTIKTW